MSDFLNSSLSTNALTKYLRPLNEKFLLVQVLVGIFLYVNCMMIFTFLSKERFREDTRYILFAQTLFADSVLMVLTDMLLVDSYYQYPVPMIPCLIVCTIIGFLSVCTPLTFAAMCLERYIAICMPLRHAILTTRIRFIGLVIIWSISSIVPMFCLIVYLAVAPGAIFSYAVCSFEVMLVQEWQAQTRASILEILFIFLIIIIVFTYIKIMKAARAASSENNKSTTKSLRTVMLHAFQLFLCIMQFLNPYIEMMFWKADVVVFVNVRYSNYIVFIIAPRCLSPLIYGLRDEAFFLVLRHHALWGLDKCFLAHSKCTLKIRAS